MKKFGNFSAIDLYHARRILLEIKTRKLREKTKDHLHDKLGVDAVRYHLHSEYLEFLKAYGEDNKDQMKSELADISNCVDILFMILLKEESR